MILVAGSRLPDYTAIRPQSVFDPRDNLRPLHRRTPRLRGRPPPEPSHEIAVQLMTTKARTHMMHPGHMPRHTRPVSPLSNANLPSAWAVVVMPEGHPAPRPCVLRAANCYPSQNARMASCSACTLENPKAAAAASRPPNFVASAETLVP